MKATVNLMNDALLNRMRQTRFKRSVLFLWVVGFAFALGAPAGLAHDQVPGAAQSQPVLLRGGDLYTVSDGIRRNTDLLFEGGKIRQIGSGLRPPAGTQVVDVRGSRVYPGLIAPNTLMGLIEIGAVRATNDVDEIGSISPEALAYVAYNPDSEVIPTVRSHGITTVQVSPGGSLIRGRSFITHLDGWTVEDSAVKLIDGMYISWPRVAVSRSRFVRATPEEQKKNMKRDREQLRDMFDKGLAYHLAREADPTLPTDIRLEAMRPLFTRELPLFVIADDHRQIVEAVTFAKERDLRLVLVGGREAYKLTDMLREEDIPIILTSVTAMPFREDDDYDAGYKLAKRIHDAGLRFCLSHTSFGGAWDVRNLPLHAGRAVAYGLPADAALRAMTLSVAEILGIDDTQGSLAVGKHATLFVSKGDVMDLLGQKVTHMFINGREVDLDNRHKMLWRKYQKKTYPLPSSNTQP